jgi:hypothetical protein
MTIRDAILANAAFTDAQILAHVQNKATVNPIDRQALANAARESGALTRLRTNLSSGTTAQKDAAQAILDLLAYGANSIRTDLTNADGTARGEFTILANTNGFTLQERTVIVSMAGGLLHATTTLADVTATRAVLTTEAARATRASAIAADDASVTAAWNDWSNARDIYIRDGGTQPAKPFGA